MKHIVGLLAIFMTLAAGGEMADARPVANVFRIGFLLISPSQAAPSIEAFRRALRERGYTEGQNIVFEYRYAEGRVEPLPDLATELVHLKVDVIVTQGTPAARAAKNATSTIPIVIAAALDPVETGLVASLARPGGNITGLTIGGSELSGKTLELLKEVVPRVARVAVLWNSDNAALALTLNETQVAARALGVHLQPLDVRDPNEFEGAFSAMARERAGALLVLNEPIFLTHRKRIADLAAKSRLPAMYERRDFVDAGGLMSYGVNFPDNFRRAATFVDKILKGAKPGDLPVEHPTKFELIINLKTAKKIGLTIPPEVLMWADKVIK